MKNWHRKTTLGITCALALFASLTAPSSARAQDPAVYYISAAALLTVLPGYLFDLPQPDSKRSYIKASGGMFDAVDDENRAVDFSLEYQPGFSLYRIKPLVGIAGNTDGSIYGWLSIAHDFHMTKHFVVNFNIGPAFYIGGQNAKNLGSAGVLRSGFEVGYRFDGGARLTSSFHHMSHGKLLNDKINPGTEIISMNLSWPLN